jgi:hypothetical protein
MEENPADYDCENLEIYSIFSIFRGDVEKKIFLSIRFTDFCGFLSVDQALGFGLIQK